MFLWKIKRIFITSMADICAYDTYLAEYKWLNFFYNNSAICKWKLNFFFKLLKNNCTEKNTSRKFINI